MMNRSLLAKEASKTVIPGSCALSTSPAGKEKELRVSQMFDSHKLKLLSITSENIFPVVFDDCIEQGERGRSLGKDKSACAGLVERIAASRITKTTIAQCDCVKIIDWKDWIRMDTRQSSLTMSISDSALLFCLSFLLRFACGSSPSSSDAALQREFILQEAPNSVLSTCVEAKQDN